VVDSFQVSCVVQDMALPTNYAADGEILFMLLRSKSRVCLCSLLSALLFSVVVIQVARGYAHREDDDATRIAALLSQGKMAEAKNAVDLFVEKARAPLAQSDSLLKSAQALADAHAYLESAELTALIHDAAPTEPERTAAEQMLIQLQPHYQKQVDLDWVKELRTIREGKTLIVLPQMRRIRRLICDPEEGLLTTFFIEFSSGDHARALEMLEQWIAAGKRTPQELTSTRLAQYYDPYCVATVVGDSDVYPILARTFGRYAAAHMDKVVEEAHLPAEPPVKTVNPRDGAILMLVPAGKFLMGDRETPNNPRRAVTLSEYWIYQKLVTVDMYRKFCKATGRPMPSEPVYIDYHFNPGWKKGNHPIVNVSWDDAVAYATWAGVTLPTEAQWEKAARGTDGRKYPWGNQYDPHKLHHSNDDGDARGTAPTGAFLNGVSPYGAFDMAGNVFQWCSDYYMADYYKYSPDTDPTGPTSGHDRAVRCASWYDDDDVDYVASRRAGNPKSFKSIYTGFRCAQKM